MFATQFSGTSTAGKVHLHSRGHTHQYELRHGCLSPPSRVRLSSLVVRTSEVRRYVELSHGLCK